MIIVVTAAIIVSILFNSSFFFSIYRNSIIGNDISSVGSTPVLIICGQEARSLLKLRNFSMVIINEKVNIEVKMAVIFVAFFPLSELNHTPVFVSPVLRNGMEIKNVITDKGMSNVPNSGCTCISSS